MSILLDQERNFLYHTFIVMHGRRGQTVLALDEVSKEIRSVDQQKNPAYWAELAQQQVVLSQAAAFLEKSLALAAPYLVLASEAAVNAYPIATTSAEAMRKAVPWSLVYGLVPEGAFETFRTTVGLLETLRQFENGLIVHSFQPVQRSLLNVMNKFSQEDQKPIRGALLAQLEYAPYSKVVRENMVEKLMTEYPDSTALISALTAWLGRAARKSDFSESWRTVRQIMGVLKHSPHLIPQAVRDVGRRTLSSKDARRADWGEQYRADHSTLSLWKLAEPWGNMRFASDGETVWRLR